MRASLASGSDAPAAHRRVAPTPALPVTDPSAAEERHAQVGVIDEDTVDPLSRDHAPLRLVVAEGIFGIERAANIYFKK